MIYRRREATRLRKHGVEMWIYSGRGDCEQAAVAYQETARGHGEEFVHRRSAVVFYILEGQGTWVIEDREYPVRATDVVIVPPGKRFHYRGRLKQICVTAPAWDEAHERHVRDVAL